MSVISTVEAVPSRLRLLYAYLEGRSGEERSRLVTLAGPKPLQSGGEEADRHGETVTRPIAEALRLGILIEEEGRLIATPLDRARRKAIGFDAAFIELVERLLLDPASPAREEQRAFPRALAWLLMQSPLRPISFSENPRTRLREQLGDGDDYELTNFSNFQNLVYWARALGYCGILGMEKPLVVVDPTVALRRHLAGFLPNKGEMRIAEVVTALATRVPVFENGTVREEVEARVIAQAERSRFSPSTSLALKRLADANLIRLVAHADADARVLDLGDATERVTHIARAKEL